jgi:plastocyanin
VRNPVRNSLLLPAAAVLAATIVAAGCGGTSTSAPVDTTKVSMAKSYRFDPASIRISAGDTVTWTNNDNFTHTVKVDGRADHKVGRGESVSITFGKPGTYHYECTLHSHDMHGTVIVT